MAALTATNPTFIDLAKHLGPDGNIMPVAEILNETNEILDEIVWQEGNLLTGHRHSVRTGLPAATWGKLYQGVQPSKGTKVQVTDNCGFLESLSEVDKRLVQLAPNPMEFRAAEDRPHIEIMGQYAAEAIFKGVSSDTDQIVGLEERFNSLSAANGQNIITNSIGEDTDVTSVWLIGWSPKSVFGIVPRGSNIGLKEEDWGEDIKADANGGYYKVYRTYWRWDMGLAMPDWRYVVRMQVDESELVADASSGVNLPMQLSYMESLLPSDAFSTTRLAFYMNRTVAEKYRTQKALLTKTSTLTMENVGGITPRRKFVHDGIPINRVDVLAADETLVE
jgi:hypothetical protein